MAAAIAAGTLAGAVVGAVARQLRRRLPISVMPPSMATNPHRYASSLPGTFFRHPGGGGRHGTGNEDGGVHVVAGGASGSRPVAAPTMTTLEYAAALDPSMRFALDRKTRIVATLGPSTASQGALEAALEAGVDVARINCAHGNAKEYAALVSTLHAAAAAVRARAEAGGIAANHGRRADLGTVAIAFDIKGPEIRVGRFDTSVPMNSSGSREIAVARGERLLLTTDPDLAACGSKARGIYIAYPSLASHMRRGSKIYIVRGLGGTNAPSHTIAIRPQPHTRFRIRRRTTATWSLRWWRWMPGAGTWW